MIIVPLDMELNSKDFSEAEDPRSDGLHLSQIISSLNEVRGTKYPDTDNATKQAYFTVGFVWERILKLMFVETAIKTSNGTLVRPGEFHMNGIAMSPDALDLEAWALEEYKATYLSSSHDIEEPCFWPWMVQMKCYCKAVGTQSCRLRVWFVVGDWKGSGPQVRAWTFHFKPQEIDETWAMVQNHAKAKGWL